MAEPELVSGADPITLPKKLDPLTAIRVGAYLTSAASGGRVSVVVPRSMQSEPFGMLYLANVARHLRSTGTAFDVDAPEPHSYVGHMGLLGQFDERFERYVSDIRENDRYIAIREVTRSRLNALANEQGVANVGETIEREAVKLAELLAQGGPSHVVFALTYCLREIMRNAYEHSGATEVLVCAQYRPSSGRVDLAFSDGGYGIFNTLRRNRRVSVSDEAEAIQVALMPGVSGAGTGRSVELRGMEDDPWKNTGYGLYMTQTICRDDGVFLMASNNAFLRLATGRKIMRTAAAHGTVVGMTVNVDGLRQIDNRRLLEFHREGAALAKKLGAGNITASAASLNLRMVD